MQKQVKKILLSLSILGLLAFFSNVVGDNNSSTITSSAVRQQNDSKYVLTRFSTGARSLDNQNITSKSGVLVTNLRIGGP